MIDKDKSVKSLIAEMTLDEKIAQMGSYWMWDLQTKGALDEAKFAEKLNHGIGQITRVGGASALNPVGIAKAGNRIQKFLVEQTRLGIPAILHEETCMGTMVVGGSVFPQMIGLAATFQPELAEEMTRAIRKQMLAIGGRHSLAPVLDLGRDPRWGRLEETFGEDPVLASQFGTAYVQGMQGDDLTKGVLATGKHFIGHSMSAGGLNCGPVHIGMNEIYDMFMVPFQAAIRDAGLATMMNSYPELDGEVVAASKRILTDLLRDKLGFDGLVVSDYDAIIMINNYHFLAETKSRAAALALRAGIDVEWPTVTCYGDPLRAALKAGDVSLEMIDLAVGRHLEMKFKLGLFDDPYVDESSVMDVFETPENRSLARKIAQQSIVLLKNDGILPLKKDIKTLAVIGPTASDGRMLLGDYSHKSMHDLAVVEVHQDSMFYNLDPSTLANDDIEIISLLEGIRSAVSPDTVVQFAKGVEPLSEEMSGISAAVDAARAADLVILTLGDKSGLTPECTSGETRDSATLRLPGMQEMLANAVLETGKPVVLVLTSGRPYEIGALAEKVNAVVQAWLPGEEGGNALADILFGDVNPGGRLPVTFPRSVGQVPINYNHKASGMKSNWWIDYMDESVTPLYPFGFGLSYTQFEYHNFDVSASEGRSGDVVDISVTVKNVGDQAGDEVVQLYIRDEYASVPRPMKELKGFIRIHLSPGEEQRVCFHLPVDQLAFIDNHLDLVLEKGRIFLMVGSSSEDIWQRGVIQVIETKQLPLNERVFVCPVTVG